MPRQINRRRFLKQSAFAGATILVGPGLARTYAANGRLDMASIGAGGQAGGGIGACLGENCIAVAEVDMRDRGRKGIERVRKEAPDAKLYTDYRRLFDAHRKLDAVWVATPDHNHFAATMRAFDAGAGVYCEKPLTWSVREARTLAETAARKKLATQMGNQGHAGESIRRLCDYVWAGALGDVTRVDCVSNRRFSAGSRPADGEPPEGLDWQAWIGPAPYRQYHDGLHPFSWRGWLDFGTGSLGDMGCHTMDGAVWALKLTEAPSVEVEPIRGEPTEQGFPPQAIVEYRFPARGGMPPVTLRWYHGGLMPPRPEALEAGRNQLTQGTYYYGSKHVAMTGSHCGQFRIIPEAKHNETPVPPQVAPRVSGGHKGDFLRAVRRPGDDLPSSHFGYGARLTEIVLLGNVASLAGQTVRYDFATGRAAGAEANALLERRPRDGWQRGYA